MTTHKELIARLRRLAFVNRNSDKPELDDPIVTWRELNEIADALEDAAKALEGSPECC
jgi:hypothetical protein